MIEGRLAWGLLSTARINSVVIPPIGASMRSMLLAVASREAPKALAYAEARSIPRAYGSYEEMLADPDLDVVYNSLPNSLHAQWSIKALRAGKHVLCEKPMALTVAEADELAETAKSSGRVVAEAFMYRHHPQTRLVRKLVMEGAVGRVLSMRGSFTFGIKDESDPRLNGELGGGSIWDIGCYPISYARFVAGAEPVEARGRAVMGKGGVDEGFWGDLLFPKTEILAEGCLLQFDSGFRSPYRTRFEISGTEGTLTVSSPFKPEAGDTITLKRLDRTETIELAAVELYAGEIADIEAAVIDGKPQAVGLADSRGNAAAIVALIKAARSKSTVSL
ncbi:MAG: Gfo/Idh/MocA family oxidoreductase [Spirochaetota bacterium]